MYRISEVEKRVGARVSEIKERLSKTTPGMWAVSTPQQSLILTPPVGSLQVENEDGKTCFVEINGTQARIEDMEFLAHAKEDIGYLLWLVEQMAE